ncbi:MAG: lipopolysaccharide biosynthesis protein RfbH [Deltaproteobacteria bacterium]|nr:lipopolysaccharide biosynthesis protein RfbH [Deltaproteobacteria bacterium]
MNPAELRERILGLVAEYAHQVHEPRPFVAGASPVPVSGRVFGAEELQLLTDSALDFWLTTGRFNEAFERGLKEFVGVRHALTANSGSSANLLAVASLTSPSLGDRALRPGDEVITVAAGFPTTVNPILLYGLVPVFVDVDVPTYNASLTELEAAIGTKTRAIVLAHTLGNPFAVGPISELARKHDLWLIEDCCDALGSTYHGRNVGTFGDLATLSFYPAHHITMGEGGAVLTPSPKLKKLVESFRDWGRDCYCAPGADNTCGKRFEWQLGELPFGYDHKYIYSHLGYNLKITDMQAAVGCAQLDRLPGFIEARKRNYRLLRERLSGLESFLILPEATPGSEPSWFGFPVTIRPECGVSRRDLLRFLDGRKIGSRQLFGGNLTRQPYFKDRELRCASPLANTDLITSHTFWLGVFPGITLPMIDFVAESLADFLVRGRR